jgi:hypothetical protein
MQALLSSDKTIFFCHYVSCHSVYNNTGLEQLTFIYLVVILNLGEGGGGVIKHKKKTLKEDCNLNMAIFSINFNQPLGINVGGINTIIYRLSNIHVQFFLNNIKHKQKETWINKPVNQNSPIKMTCNFFGFLN